MAEKNQQPDHMMHDGPISKLVESMHKLTVELETHRTHAHGFMLNQEVINRQLQEILSKQAILVREIEHNQIRHDERLGRVESEMRAVAPKIDELRTTIAKWLGIGIGCAVVFQTLIQVIPLFWGK